MNIICIGYYDKFSRFFLDISEHLKTNRDSHVKLNIYSLHFSGFFYNLIRFRFSSWLPVKAWFLSQQKKRHYNRIIRNSEVYKDISYNRYIIFHKAINKNISTIHLQRQALAYIDIFDDLFDKQQPDYLISIGDSRLCIEVATAVAKHKNIKIYYIEQGPNNTTFFDDKGINANLSIRTESVYRIKSVQDLKVDVNLNSSTKKYNRSPIYRGLDIIFMKIFEKTNIYPPDLKYTDLNSYRHKRSSSKIKLLNNSNKKPFILLILQVPIDVNMIYHSPLFKSHTEIIINVYSSLPKNTLLVVREHPLFINKYESTMYDFIKENNITIDNTTPLNKAIELAQIIIVNNSTVGIEAILIYKTVVVLGNAFYDNENICLKLKNKANLANVLANSLNHTPDKQQIDNFRHLLYNTVLLKGAITDKDLKSSKHIANHLLTNY